MTFNKYELGGMKVARRFKEKHNREPMPDDTITIQGITYICIGWREWDIVTAKEQGE